jgi:hypothetical protein
MEIPPQDSEAYLLYLRGRYYLDRQTTSDVRTSIDYFQQALARNPNSARAYAGRFVENEELQPQRLAEQGSRGFASRLQAQPRRESRAHLPISLASILRGSLSWASFLTSKR